MSLVVRLYLRKIIRSGCSLGNKLHGNISLTPAHTVNSEIFARTSFSQNLALGKFCENKTLGNWQNHSVIY